MAYFNESVAKRCWVFDHYIKLLPLGERLCKMYYFCHVVTVSWVCVYQLCNISCVRICVRACLYYILFFYQSLYQQMDAVPSGDVSLAILRQRLVDTNDLNEKIVSINEMKLMIQVIVHIFPTFHLMDRCLTVYVPTVFRILLAFCKKSPSVSRLT